MHNSPRTIPGLVLAAAFSGLLAGCTGTPGDETMIQFAMNSDNNVGCSRVLVEVDLSFPDIATRDDGSIHCALSGELEKGGCKVDFLEIDGGGALQVEIHDCDVPAGSNLFRCAFTDYDLSEFEDSVDIVCACKSSNCDPTPPVCLGEAAKPGPCEDCDNRRDDDGDGLVDCADPGCQVSRLCDGTNTTTTTSSTSTTFDSTTTSSSTSTTTTLPVTTTTLDGPTTTTTTIEEPTTTTTVPTGGGPFDVTFHLDSASTELGALQFTADYAAAPGEFEGSGAAVTCTNKVGGALFAPNDSDGTSKLTLGIIALSPFAAPLDLVTCTFLADGGTPVPGDFVVTIDDATDIDGAPATVAISVALVAK